MDGKLIQNNLAEATTEMGFPADVNFPLQREVTLEDGSTVIVEGVTPDKMKTILNQNVDGNEEAITFLTPGEDYVKDEEVLIKGVCQDWNESIIPADLVSIAITTPPTKQIYYAGDTFDATGMVVTGTYSNESTKVITEYTISPDGALTTEDTEITVTVGDKTATQAITVNAVELVGIAVTTAPSKTTYYEGETFNPAGMVVTATYNNGATSPISEYTYSPNGELALVDDTITIEYEDKSATQSIVVQEDTLQSIAVTTAPTKTTYTEGEIFDDTGMVITGTYASGKTETISEYTVTPSTALAITDTYVTISVNELSCTQAITVEEVVVTYFTLEAGKEYSFNTSALSQFIFNNTSAEQKSASINIDGSDDTPFFWIPNINNSEDPVKNSFYIIADADRKELSMYLNDDGIGGSKSLGEIEGESEISTVDLGDALNIMSMATGVISVPGSALNTTYLDDNCTIYLRYLPSGAENYVDYPLTLKLSTYITEAQI